MAYTAVWWEIPGEVLTELNFLFLVRLYIVNQPTPIHGTSVSVCYLEHNSFTSCEDLFVKIYTGIANCRTDTMVLSYLNWWPVSNASQPHAK